jgi:hypothetical protein
MTRTPTEPRFTADRRATSLALLRARIARLPGVTLRDRGPAPRRGPIRLELDVRGTGRSGFELGRRMRAFSGVPLEVCRDDRLVAVFEDDEALGRDGERLLFALAHACHDAAPAAAPAPVPA